MIEKFESYPDIHLNILLKLVKLTIIGIKYSLKLQERYTHWYLKTF